MYIEFSSSDRFLRENLRSIYDERIKNCTFGFDFEVWFYGEIYAVKARGVKLVLGDMVVVRTHDNEIHYDLASIKKIVWYL